ncbi:MAG TPA: KamA family radical SAM protein [Bacillota bacterium]|nr:KamA family radical SAM protein [Bacillota bacterium]
MKRCDDYMTRYPHWNDWHWQYANRITTADGIAKYLGMDDTCRDTVAKCLDYFRMAITPYYASLIDPSDPDDVIRKICVPSIDETIPCDADMSDPLGEVRDSPVAHIVHRYPDRVLFLVTLRCSSYCRYCTRRRVVGEEDRIITDAELKNAIGYISNHTEIRDVLISGGDPLVMSTEKLEHIIAALRAIPHVDIIRIGTRVPVVLPMRITQELLNMLKKYQPIWMNIHFTHPRELTPECQHACAALADAGIPLGSQTVLLRGINDDPQIMKQLMLGLVHMRVRPYYIYQCDLSQGIGHFRTTVDKGIEIMHSLQGYISGFAVPKFVIDAPGGGGKIPVNYEYIISKDEKEVIMENYCKKTCRYPQPRLTDDRAQQDI